MKNVVVGCALLIGFATAGCSSPKPILERGWIGGEFEMRGVWVPGKGEGDECREGVLVTDVYPETPLAAAGVEEGDVILAIGDQPVEDRDELIEQVVAANPGDALQLALYRVRDGSGEQKGAPGQELVQTVVTGVERYKRMGTLSLGLGFGTQLDFWPPEMNILGLLRFSSYDQQPQFQSPPARLRQSLKEGDLELRGSGWSFWCLIFGLGKYDAIVAQEALPSGVLPQ